MLYVIALEKALKLLPRELAAVVTHRLWRQACASKKHPQEGHCLIILVAFFNYEDFRPLLMGVDHNKKHAIQKRTSIIDVYALPGGGRPFPCVDGYWCGWCPSMPGHHT